MAPGPENGRQRPKSRGSPRTWKVGENRRKIQEEKEEEEEEEEEEEASREDSEGFLIKIKFRINRKGGGGFQRGF